MSVHYVKESLQIAPLGGRILFKNFRYHSRNQSITVLHGFISFRYWLWNVRTEDEPIPEDSGFSKDGGTTKGKYLISDVLINWHIFLDRAKSSNLVTH